MKKKSETPSELNREVTALVLKPEVRRAVVRSVRLNMDRARQLAPVAGINGGGLDFSNIDTEGNVSAQGLLALSDAATGAVNVLDGGLALLGSMVLPPREGDLQAILAVEDWLGRGGSDLTAAAKGWAGVFGRLSQFDLGGARQTLKHMELLSRFNDSIGVLQPVLQVGLEAAEVLPSLVDNVRQINENIIHGQDQVTQARIAVLDLIAKLEAARKLTEARTPEVARVLGKLSEELNSFTLDNASLEELRGAVERCGQIEAEAIAVVESYGASMELPNLIALVTNDYLTKLGLAPIRRQALAMARNAVYAALTLQQLSFATLAVTIGQVIDLAAAAQQKQMGQIEGAVVDQLRQLAEQRLRELPERIIGAKTLEDTSNLMLGSFGGDDLHNLVESEFREEDGGE